MNTYLIIILVLLFILMFLFLNINIFITKDESFNISVKIGLFSRFNIDVSKLVPKLIKNFQEKKLDLLIFESKQVNSLCKYINIDKITIIEYTNIFLDTWNINTCFLLNMSNLYIESLLHEHFNKVKDVYYSVGFNTIGGLSIKVDAHLSIRIYQIIRYLLHRRRYHEQRN